MKLKSITLLLLLLLVLISCKPEPKNEATKETAVEDSVSQMWEDYTASNPEFKKDEIPEFWFFHDNKADADRLANLTLNGKKTAMTSGLYVWYEEVGAELPSIGTKHIVTNFEGGAQAIIEITQVDTIPFNQLPKEYAAMDMGTSGESLEKWRKAHWKFFSKIMEENGEQPSEDMLIVFEQFKTIWPEKK